MISSKNSNRNDFTVLGIDPGLETTGWALVERQSLSESRILGYGILNTPAHRTLSERLEMIFNYVGDLIKNKKPDFAAIEEMFFLKKAKTVLATVQTRGVILLACRLSKIPTETFSPKQIKLSVAGSGSATKAAVAKMVQLTLNLKKLPKPNDITDAMAVALCYIKTVPLKNKMAAALL
jgi:crossover junction endodeoxyribonuclease RuvC